MKKAAIVAMMNLRDVVADLEQFKADLSGEAAEFYAERFAKCVATVCDELQELDAFMSSNPVVKEHLRVLKELKIARGENLKYVPPFTSSGEP